MIEPKRAGSGPTRVGRRTKKSETPLLDAAKAWVAQANKGECFTYFRGNIVRSMQTPEQNMSNAERREHTAACKAAKKAKQPKPAPPDPYAHEREDARQLTEFIERQELRGVVETRIVVMSRSVKHYEIECIVQRNGLPGVRARRGIYHGAA